jgi:hypothetical protein
MTVEAQGRLMEQEVATNQKTLEELRNPKQAEVDTNPMTPLAQLKKVELHIEPMEQGVEISLTQVRVQVEVMDQGANINQKNLEEPLNPGLIRKIPEPIILMKKCTQI